MKGYSKCCKAEIETRHEEEEPLNDGFKMKYKYPACSKCGEEHPDEIELCDNCGEREATEDVELGRYCKECSDSTAIPNEVEAVYGIH